MEDLKTTECTFQASSHAHRLCTRAHPLHTLTYPSIPLHTPPYPCIPLYTLPYLAYTCVPLHTPAYHCILLHTLAYPPPANYWTLFYCMFIGVYAGGKDHGDSQPSMYCEADRSNKGETNDAGKQYRVAHPVQYT